MSDAEHLLSELVDTLISPGPTGDPPVAYLIRKNRADAVVVLRASMNALVFLADAAPGADLAARAQAALAAERPDVRAGVGEAVRFLVLVGERPPQPATPAGFFELLAVTRDATQFVASARPLESRDVPKSRAQVLAELETARRRLRRSPTALPAAALARAEQEGEAALAAEGVYARRLVHPYGTAAVVVFSILMFVLQLRLGGLDAPIMVRMGANVGRLVAQGEWERVLTAGYLHFGFVHFATNMIVLYLVGMFVEAALGPARFVALYTAVVAGSESVVAWLRPDQVGCGASGGILGLIAALAMLSWRAPRLVPPISGRATAYASGIYLGIQMLYALRPEASFVGHAAGAAVGAAVIASGAFQLGLPDLRTGAREPGWSRALSTLGALAAVLVTAVALYRAFARGRPWEGLEPPRLVPGVLARTGLRGRFPEGAFAHLAVTSGDGFVKYRIGDYAVDPLVISLIDREHAVPDGDGEAALAHLRESIRTGKDPGRWSAPVIKMLGAHHAARSEHRGYGSNLVRWLFGAGGRELDAQISWVAPATPAHEQRAEECLASLERARR